MPYCVYVLISQTDHKLYIGFTTNLEARIKEVEIALQDTSVKKQEAAQRLEQGKAQINEMMAAMQQQPTQPPKTG